MQTAVLSIMQFSCSVSSSILCPKVLRTAFFSTTLSLCSKELQFLRVHVFDSSYCHCCRSSVSSSDLATPPSVNRDWIQVQLVHLPNNECTLQLPKCVMCLRYPRLLTVEIIQRVKNKVVCQWYKDRTCSQPSSNVQTVRVVCLQGHAAVWTEPATIHNDLQRPVSATGMVQLSCSEAGGGKDQRTGVVTSRETHRWMWLSMQTHWCLTHLTE